MFLKATVSNVFVFIISYIEFQEKTSLFKNITYCEKRGKFTTIIIVGNNLIPMSNRFGVNLQYELYAIMKCLLEQLNQGILEAWESPSNDLVWGFSFPKQSYSFLGHVSKSASFFRGEGNMTQMKL